MKRILVAIDGSDASLDAGRIAIDLARGLGAELTFVYVAAPSLAPTDAPWLDELNRNELAAGDKVLAEAIAALGAVPLMISTRSILGAPAESIAELARAEDFDLIVVGSTGKNAVQRVLLGSVADRLMHSSEKPVLVARAHQG
jgi:nucleotide-binding universal stress UspA family protein